MNELRGTYFLDRNAYVAQEEPAIFHCHHYNCYLQAVINDTKDYLPGVTDILLDTAQEISYHQFSNHFKSNGLDADARKQIVADYFRFVGFGIINLSDVTEKGGKVESKSDHYGVGWNSKFGKSGEPVSFFTTGFLSGATEAIYDLKLGTLQGTQDQCIAKGDQASTFNLIESESDRKLDQSPGEGASQGHSLNQPTGTQVDYSAIRDALIGMPIEGDGESGLIDAFGVLLTRHYANYYCGVSNKFLDLFQSKLGEDGLTTAISLLTEAGHVCAFNTFGGIMQSNEWNSMIKPMFQNDDDWIHGIVAVVNSFGWGFWEIDEFVPNELLRLKIHGGYESNSYVKGYPKSNFPVSFLATGGTAGLMNLVYILDLPNTAPVTLDEDLYKRIHSDPGFFRAKQLKCRAMGDAYDLIEATRG